MLRVLIGRLAAALAGAAVACGMSAGPAAAGGALTPLDAHVAAVWQPIAGPSLTGSGAVAWATPSDAHDGFDVSVLEDGSLSSRHVRSAGADPNARVDLTSVSLGASPDAVALGVDAQRCTVEGCRYDWFTLVASKLFGGVGGGPLASLGCAGGGVPGAESVDVEGTTVAYVDSCAGGAAVRDLAAPDTPSLVFPAYSRVRMAGSYVAVDSRDVPTVAVYDRRTGEKVYAVDAPEEGIGAFDVREDGLVAFMRASQPFGPFELDWASREEPYPHTVAAVSQPASGRVSTLGEVRIAGSQVAARFGGLYRVYGLDGSERASTPDGDAIGSFDFDGQHLVFGAQPCESVWIVDWDLAGTPPARPPGRCPRGLPATFRGEANLRERVLRVAMRCPATPALGCTGSWAAVVRTKVPSNSYSRVVALGPGETMTIPFRLSRLQACAYARGEVRATGVGVSDRFTARRLAPGRQATLRKVRLVGRARGCRR